MLLPNVRKRYISTARKSFIYSVILQKRCLTVHCYRGGIPAAIHTIGDHAWSDAPAQHFEEVRPIPFDDRLLMKAESGLLITGIWDSIDFDELTQLLGRGPDEW